MVRRKMLPILAGLVLAPAVAFSATNKELEERIKYLEENYQEAMAGLDDLNGFNERQMKLSGYADVEYHSSGKTDTPSYFRLHHMSVFFEKDFGDDWRFFSEIEYEDAPKFEGAGEAQTGGASGEIVEDAKGKIFLESITLTYQWKPEANIRFGRMFTPAGIWSIDHYPPFVPTQERPQHIRKIFPQVVDGMQAFGTLTMGRTFANYDVYMGNGTGNTGKNDKNDAKATGAKLSFILPMLDHLEIGASIYSDPEDSAKNDESYSANGFHGKLKYKDTTLQFEHASGSWDDDELKGYYAQLGYDWNKYTIGVRHDYYDSDVDDSTLDKSGITQNSIFINYHVNSSITLKAEYHKVDHEDTATRDYGKSVLSVVGYLGN